MKRVAFLEVILAFFAVKSALGSSTRVVHGTFSQNQRTRRPGRRIDMSVGMPKHICKRVWIPLALFGALVMGLGAASVFALIGDTPTIRSIALGRGPEPGNEVLTMIGQAPDGAFKLIVTKLFPATGEGGVELFLGVEGVELFDVALEFGAEDSIDLGVGAGGVSLNVHFFNVTFAPDGSLRVTGPTTLGPFGDPAVDGRPVAIAWVPNPPNPVDPFIAIGTDSGKVLIIQDDRVVGSLMLGGPIVDLAVVPQVGYFAIVALVNEPDGQHLVGIRPPDPTADPPILAHIVFDLTASSIGVFIFENLAFSGGLTIPFQTEPSPIYLLAASSTRFVHRLTIPANPTIGGTFRVRSIPGPPVPVRQVSAGSLAMLPVDGSGVLYDPAFDVGQGGLSEPLFTIFGSSLELQPRSLSLSRRGQYISGIIEVANGNAGEIDPTSVVLHVNGGSVPASPNFAPQLGDADGDGNTDLKVKFDRAAVQALIPSEASSILATAQWQFTDGSAGFASAEIGVVQ